MICRICQSKAGITSKYTHLGFDWARCQNCKSTQKILNPSQYQALNPTYDPGMYIPNINSFQMLRESLGVDEKKRFLERVLPNCRGKSFLDVGCGMGGFLIAAEELGMAVAGYEPSSQHASVLRGLSGVKFPIENAYFSSAGCSRRFDFVLISHVIEHIFDQRAFLEDLGKVLLPGGKIIVVTPNNESLEALLSRRWWVMYKPIDHVGLIGSKAANLLSPKGFTVELNESDEYPGEFAVQMLSAFKSVISPAVTGVQREDGKSYRLQVSQKTIPVGMRWILILFSVPFSVLGWLTDRRACLTAVYQKAESDKQVV